MEGALLAPWSTKKVGAQRTAAPTGQLQRLVGRQGPPGIRERRTARLRRWRTRTRYSQPAEDAVENEGIQ
jgi:hypothetical protein